MQSAGPYVSRTFEVEQAWIDYNGHMNMAYYPVLFDRGFDELALMLGMGPDYARARRLTTFTGEIHICYLRELHQADRVTVSCQLLDFDEKRLHVFQELRHSEGWVSATCECLTLHVDLNGPRVAPFPPDIAENVARLHSAHAALPVPDRAGRAIVIRHRT